MYRNYGWVVYYHSIQFQDTVVWFVDPIKLRSIPAVEMDCTFKGCNLHLLGYGISVPNPRPNNIERAVKNQRRSASSVMIEKVKALGIFFNVENVMKLAVEGVVTGEMIAEVTLDDQRNMSNPLMAPFLLTPRTNNQ